MRRWVTIISSLVIASLIVAWLASRFLVRVEPIRVGLLHSQSGPFAISERSMIHGELLALEEINARGGLLGRRVEGVIADGQSDGPTFAREAQRLIEREKVVAIFGCWASASRKSVKPVIEQHHHLLFYPTPYEGLEQSPNIVYTGAAPNQQVIPAVNWCFHTLGARRFFLVGTDYVWPHCVNEIIKDQLKALEATLAGESYIPLDSAAVEAAVEAIVRAKPDVIISTVVGGSNAAFYQRLRAARPVPADTPVMSFGIAEDELRELPLEAMVGDYAAWDYFQSIDRAENREFVRRFQEKYGDDRVTSDVIEAAYSSVHLWAQAVAEADAVDVASVLKAIGRQSRNAPEGIISVDAETQHTWRSVYIGRIRGDGQFDLVWRSEKPVRPLPYPPSRTRLEWESFLNNLHRSWGGWANPSPARGQDGAQGGGGSRPSLRARSSLSRAAARARNAAAIDRRSLAHFFRYGLP